MTQNCLILLTPLKFFCYATCQVINFIHQPCSQEDDKSLMVLWCRSWRGLKLKFIFWWTSLIIEPFGIHKFNISKIILQQRKQHQGTSIHMLDVFKTDLNIQFKEVHIKKMAMRINQRQRKMFVFDKLTVMWRKYRMCLMIHKFQQIRILIHSCELILWWKFYIPFLCLKKIHLWFDKCWIINLCEKFEKRIFPFRGSSWWKRNVNGWSWKWRTKGITWE